MTRDTATVVVGALTDPDRRAKSCAAPKPSSCLGPHPNAPEGILRHGDWAIIAGMRTQQVSRLLCVTGAMIGEAPATCR
jgi:hypothetical protein